MSNLNYDIHYDVPLEINLNKLKNYNELMILKSKISKEIQFLIQKTPSIFSSEDHSYSTIIPESVIEGEYLIKSIANKTNFRLIENEKGQLTILEKENPVLTYNFGMQLAEGAPERYMRSSYIHPLFDLEGNVITDDFPSDHYHHRGISWMWPKVFIDTIRYDLWHIYGQKGDLNGIHQVFEKWIYKNTGPICAVIGVKNYWQIENGPVIMDEWIDIRVFYSNEMYRTIDIKIKLKARTDLYLEGQTKKGYGGLNLRFAPRHETQITSEFGKEGDSDLKKLPWADLSAKFTDNEYFSGVTIIQNEKNHDFPAGWCLRHYGFLGVAWPGTKRYSMIPGDSLSLSFRVLVHRGKSDESGISEIYKIVQDPPELIVK